VLGRRSGHRSGQASACDPWPRQAAAGFYTRHACQVSDDDAGDLSRMRRQQRAAVLASAAASRRAGAARVVDYKPPRSRSLARDHATHRVGLRPGILEYFPTTKKGKRAVSLMFLARPWGSIQGWFSAARPAEPRIAAWRRAHRRGYRTTWWVRAQNEPTMPADLVALGVRTGW